VGACRLSARRGIGYRMATLADGCESWTIATSTRANLDNAETIANDTETRKSNPLRHNLPAYGRRLLRELLRVGGNFTR